MNEAHALYDFGHGYLVAAFALDGYALGHNSRLVLDKVERFDHKVYGDLPVHTDGEHGDHAALQAVAEYEGGATAFLHVEGDTLETAHMEEGLVLDGSEARVMQEAAVHEVSLFKEVVLVFDSWRSVLLARVKLAVVEIVGIFDDLDRIVTGLWIKPSLHEYIEEQAHRRVVRQPAVYVYRPEQGVRRRTVFVLLWVCQGCWVRERHQVHRHVPDHALLIQH